MSEHPLTEDEALSLAREKWGPLAFTGREDAIDWNEVFVVGFAKPIYDHGRISLRVVLSFSGPTWSEACYQAGILPGVSKYPPVTDLAQAIRDRLAMPATSSPECHSMERESGLGCSCEICEPSKGDGK